MPTLEEEEARILAEGQQPEQETIGIIWISHKFLQEVLMLSEGYEVIGASSDLMQPETIALQVRIRSKGPLDAHWVILTPRYIRTEIEGKRYASLDEIEWDPAEARDYNGLVTFPAWLLAPGDEVMPGHLKPFYRNLLYHCYLEKTSALVRTTGQMLKLAETKSLEAVKTYLSRLAAGGWLTWRSEGIARTRKWYVVIAPSEGERRAWEAAQKA